MNWNGGAKGVQKICHPDGGGQAVATPGSATAHSGRWAAAGLLILTFGPWLTHAEGAAHRFVALSMRVTLDAVGSPDGISPERHVGEVDHLRLIFDANAIDPLTRHVPLLNLQHETAEGFLPPEPDPVRMPVSDAWLDLSALPYRVHFTAAVTREAPIIIEFDEKKRRLTIRSRTPSHDLRLTGPYVIDPELITGDAITAAAVPH